MQEFYGCGKFVSDSWRIFCRGELALQVSGPRRVLERQLSRRYDEVQSGKAL